MPFDGTDFRAPAALDTGIFPLWSKHGFRLWIKTRFRPQSRAKTMPAVLRAPAQPDRSAAIVQLLRDARALIADPDDWTQRTYWSFRGRRCAVGALRAAARQLTDPGVAWSAHGLLIRVARSRGFTNVEAMNDRSPHAAVLRAFDQAIALAGG
jgi:hypothetical protein